MINYATWYVAAWIERSPATSAAVVDLCRRVVETGAKKHATRTGVVHVFAKNLRDSLLRAVAQWPGREIEPDLKQALHDVDWYAVAERFLERTA